MIDRRWKASPDLIAQRERMTMEMSKSDLIRGLNLDASPFEHTASVSRVSRILGFWDSSEIARSCAESLTLLPNDHLQNPTNIQSSFLGANVTCRENGLACPHGAFCQKQA